MAVLQECPFCHKKQSVRNKLCSCGSDLDKLKRAGKIRFHIAYRDREGRQVKRYINRSLDEAKLEDAAVRKGLREGNASMLPKRNITFGKLSAWYLALEMVKTKAYFKTLTYNLASFNKVFGEVLVANIKTSDIENYQARQKAAGYSDSYIDQQVTAAKTVINAAFSDNLIGYDTLRAFQKVKKTLKGNANARDRIVTHTEYKALMQYLPPFTAAVVAMAYYTGMRRDEILSLTWDKVDLKGRFIRLEAEDTKDREPRTIPICGKLHTVLKGVPRALNDNHVFLYRGGKVGDIRTALQTACTKAGIAYGRKVKGGITFHDLRHTFNTNARRAGIAEGVIMKITGHATREMFDRYNTVDESDARKAAARLSRHLSK